MTSVQSLSDDASMTRTSASTAAAAVPKLRDSCTACATSKVRCSKEKPTCTRCVRRGIACEYTASKRTGRTAQFASKHAAAQRAREAAAEAGVDYALHDLHDLGQFPGGLLSPPPLSPSDISRAGLTRHNSEASMAGLHNHPSHSRHESWCSPNSLDHANLDMNNFAGLITPTSLEPEMDDLFSAFASYSATSSSDPDAFLHQAMHNQPSAGFDSFDAYQQSDALTMKQSGNALFNGLPQPSNTILGMMPSNSMNAYGCTNAVEPSGSCLTAALGFLSQLFPKSSACTLPGGHQDPMQLPTVATVMAENKNIIDALTRILECPCSLDEYVITIISLVVLKVIAWYGAAARDDAAEAQGWSDQYGVQDRRDSQQCSYPEQVLQFPTVIGSYCVSQAEQVRMSAQLIWGELPRVQRLVNLLSERFKTVRRRRVDKLGSIGATSAESPLSAPTFDQLEADLRIRLRAVSMEISNLLLRS